MNPNERTPLILGHLFALLAVLGVVAISVTAASTGAICLFAAGIFGVVASTAALVQAETTAVDSRR